MPSRNPRKDGRDGSRSPEQFLGLAATVYLRLQDVPVPQRPLQGRLPLPPDPTNGQLYVESTHLASLTPNPLRWY